MSFEHPKTVEEVCVIFEEEWSEGRRPRIEDYLHLVDKANRSILIRDLVSLDIHWKRKSGSVDTQDYRERFPQFPASVNEGIIEEFNSRYSDEGPEDPNENLMPLVKGESPVTEREGMIDLRGEIIGEYRIEGHLRGGGMGQLYTTQHIDSNKIFVFKLLHAKYIHDLTKSLTFNTEFEVSTKLDHPNIAKVFKIGLWNGQPYIIRQHVPGIDLARFGRKNHPILCMSVCHFVSQGAEALHYAHGMGIIHRDVKPSNFMLETSGKVWLIDFGLASDQELMVTGNNKSWMGSTNYVAPEQTVNFHTADARSDIYSLGCTFYFLLSGTPPFSGGTTAEKVSNHRTSKPKSIREFRQDIPNKVINILEKMMQKNPKKRYHSMREVTEALMPYCTSNGVTFEGKSQISEIARQNELLIQKMYKRSMFWEIFKIEVSSAIEDTVYELSKYWKFSKRIANDHWIYAKQLPWNFLVYFMYIINSFIRVIIFVATSGIGIVLLLTYFLALGFMIHGKLSQNDKSIRNREHTGVISRKYQGDPQSNSTIPDPHVVTKLSMLPQGDVTEQFILHIKKSYAYRLSKSSDTPYFVTGFDVELVGARIENNALIVTLRTKEINRGIQFVGLNGIVECVFKSDNGSTKRFIIQDNDETLGPFADSGTFIVTIQQIDDLKDFPLGK